MALTLILHYLIVYFFPTDGCKVARGEVCNAHGSTYLALFDFSCFFSRRLYGSSWWGLQWLWQRLSRIIWSYYVIFTDGWKVRRCEVCNDCGGACLALFDRIMLFLQTVVRLLVVRSGMSVVAPILHFMLYCICYFLQTVVKLLVVRSGMTAVVPVHRLVRTLTPCVQSNVYHGVNVALRNLYWRPNQTARLNVWSQDTVLSGFSYSAFISNGDIWAANVWIILL